MMTEFNIRPNASFPRPGWRWLLLFLLLLSFAIALRLAWLGFWLVLPFTLLELGFLVWIIGLVRRQANYVERIRISGDKVQIAHLQKNHNRKWSFPLYWARVELKSPTHRWYPHKLLVGTSGQWIEIGQCLTDQERTDLAAAIRGEIQTQLLKMSPANA